ncbi:MAG: ferrous iron transport protein A [Anaerolineaceae bacterium]|nr:ferrous iron transport protein A [Anaerolineaceae bacterium]
MNSDIFPLSMSGVGEKVRLESIRGGDNVTKRLLALGLVPGAELRVVQAEGGPLIISVRDSRIAIGRGMAYHVMVSHIIS